MTTLQVAIKLRAFGALTGEQTEVPDLGEVSVSGTLTLPADLGTTNQLTGAMRDAIKQLWEGHYGTDMPTSSWHVTLQAECDGRLFESVRAEHLPMDFSVAVFTVIQGQIERAIAAIA